MKHISFFIILDGFRTSYITKDKMPFVSSLGKMNTIEPIPSFCQRPTIFSGNSPIKTGCFVDFVYNGGNAKWYKKYLKRYNSYNIPKKYQGYFDIEENYKKFKDKNSPLFKELKKNGYKIIWVNNFEFDFKKLKPKTVFFIHYTGSEPIAFKYGIHSKQIKAYLKRVDGSIKRIFKTAEQNGEITSLIMSDHGMTTIKENVDIMHMLNSLNSKFGSDYIVFLNSPMARFWFLNKKAEKEILIFLGGLKKYGKILSDNDFIKFKIPKEKKYGDVIFYMKNGINISPDFYHPKKIKSMHGYLDEKPPILITYSTSNMLKIKKRCNLIDIMPTFLELLKINNKTKTDGRSVLK